MYLASRAGDGREQSIPEHTKSVSARCAKFAAPQTIPLPYLLPCVRAIEELAPREIAPDVPKSIFQRVRYEHLGQLSDDELVQRLAAHD